MKKAIFSHFYLLLCGVPLNSAANARTSNVFSLVCLLENPTLSSILYHCTDIMVGFQKFNENTNKIMTFNYLPSINIDDISIKLSPAEE